MSDLYLFERYCPKQDKNVPIRLYPEQQSWECIEQSEKCTDCENYLKVQNNTKKQHP